MRKVLENIVSFALAVIVAVDIERFYFHNYDGLRATMMFTIIVISVYGAIINAFWEIEKYEKRKKIRKAKLLKKRDLIAYEKEREKIYEDNEIED